MEGAKAQLRFVKLYYEFDAAALYKDGRGDSVAAA